MTTAKTRTTRGFTLLEMMIALAILSASLTWIVVGVSRNIRAEGRAKLMTMATFLARQKMTDFEDELYTKGFGEFDKQVDGKFEDPGAARFTWAVNVDKVELPSQEALQSVMGKADQIKAAIAGQDPSQVPPQGQGASSQNPLGGMMGATGSVLSSQFGVIKEVLEQGIRRVTVHVQWREGRKQQEVAVVSYFTDPRKVDQAIQIGATPPDKKP